MEKSKFRRGRFSEQYCLILIGYDIKEFRAYYLINRRYKNQDLKVEYKTLIECIQIIKTWEMR